MIIIALTHPGQLEWLKHVLDKYARNGLPAEELPVAADTYVAVTNARDIATETHLGKATVVDAGPGGVALEFTEPANQQ